MYPILVSRFTFLFVEGTADGQDEEMYDNTSDPLTEPVEHNLDGKLIL